MTNPAFPAARPANPNFSSGPCAKRPGWSLDVLKGAALGRSHRAKIGKQKLKQAIDLTREVLEVPDTHLIGIVPASDTGALEMALWSLLGARKVDVLAWESFGLGWVTDVVKQLKLPDARTIKADYGLLPDLSQVDFTRDVVFTWNGTTSGVRVPNADWIPADREGLTICDATSAAFAQNLDFAEARRRHLLLAEGARRRGGARHDRALARARSSGSTSYTPPWPLPKIFRMTKGGKLIDGIFVGETINTPSMLCVEDYLDALLWAKSIGGLKGLQARADANFKVLADWAERTPWIDLFAVDPATRSNTSVCLKIVDPAVTALDLAGQEAFVRAIASRLDKEGVAHDIAFHRDAPPHFRIWAGATIEASDLAALTEWLDWGFALEKAALKQAA